MFKKTRCLDVLESQRQLIIAESELNRAQIVGDMAKLKDGAIMLAGHIKTIGSISSSAAVLVAGLTALQGAKSDGTASKTSWLQTILKGAGIISTLWLAIRPRGTDRKDNQ